MSNRIENISFIKKITTFFSDRKLRYDIISSFILLFLFENLITLSFTYKSNNVVSMEFAKYAMNQHSSRIVSQTQRYLDDVKKIVMLCHSLVDLKEEDGLSNKYVKDCLLQSLKQYPHFDNIYVGLANGGYLGVERCKPGTKFIKQSDKVLPNNIKYLIQIQNRTNPKAASQGVEYWGYYNEEGALVGEETNEMLNFDPRTRLWFTMAEQKGEFIWTDIYAFSGTNNLCISAAAPIYTVEDERVSRLAGVIGVDLLLEELSSFMESQKISDNGSAFIVSQSGQMVAYPSEKSSDSKFDNQRSLISINEIQQKEITESFQIHKENPQKGEFEFSNSGVNYLASFTMIDDGTESGIDWMVGVVVPKSDFSKSIDDMQRNEVFIILFVAFIATFITFYLSKRISAPILAIAQETQRLKEFYQTEPLKINSNIAEIKMMLDAISAMRASLQSFGKFVPKVLVRRLMQKGTEIKLGGKSSELTLFFSDIQGFTSISETMSPDKLVLHLSEYFNELSSIIVETNGTIDKYIGDAIMAFWNAPNTDKNHTFNACHAALLCQKRLSELNRKWELEKKPIFYTRIGLHTTEVIVGNIGSDEKINYTVMGDGVNLASRLEGTNKMYKTSILASEAIEKIVGEKFLMRPVDIVAVKGKQEGIKIFELVGQMAGDSRLLPSREEVELCKSFAKGFKLYTEQRWGEAIKHFDNLKKMYPQDYLTNLFLERCLAFKENPPKRNWDGIFVLTQK